MARYLLQATYTPEGAKGLLRDKASGRKAAVEKALSSVGAKLESMYYCFGDYDAILIVDSNDSSSVAAMSLAVCASGLAHVKTTPLLTIEETDVAAGKSVQYRGPGQ